MVGFKSGLAFWGFDDYAPQPQNRSSFSKAFVILFPNSHNCPFARGVRAAPYKSARSALFTRVL